MKQTKIIAKKGGKIICFAKNLVLKPKQGNFKLFLIGGDLP
jgi:hypothetical protein